MNPVEPIPFEPTRFFVASDSRQWPPYVVDFEFIDEGERIAKPACSCAITYNRKKQGCKHILKAEKWKLRNLSK